MKDLEIILENKPGMLAFMGEILGKHRISLEGGGVFNNGSHSIAHFLVSEPEWARKLLTEAGILVVAIHPVIIVKLRQDQPGQLGQFARRLAEANINILTQYSDHANQLIVVVDEPERARQIAKSWMQEWWPTKQVLNQ